MRAILAREYGPPEVLQLEELPVPVPKAGELLIRVRAATVTAGDCEVRRFDLPPLFWLLVRCMVGLVRPRKGILGQEFAGVVEAVGEGVSRFEVGDAVFGPTNFARGAWAEFICIPENRPLARKPTNMTFEEAATLPVGGLNSVYFLERASIQPGESVLINGAGGSIGTYGLQFAKSLGAVVTCVDSAEKLDMLRSIGADEVVDYTREEFTQRGGRYDVIFDVVGKFSFGRCVRALNPGGRLLLTHPRLGHMLRARWVALTSDKQVMTGLGEESSAALQRLVDLVEAGTLRSIIDRTFPLERMREAHRYVEAGHKAGNLVITFEGDSSDDPSGAPRLGSPLPNEGAA